MSGTTVRAAAALYSVTVGTLQATRNCVPLSDKFRIRVVYVASGDLSHRLPGSHYGYDPRGVEFDGLVADSFAAGEWRGLLSIDPELAKAAGECGYRSLAVLSGVVAAVQASGAETRNRLLSYEGPFGVGYLVGEVEIAESA